MSDFFQTLKSKTPEAAKAIKAMIDEYGGVQNFIAALSVPEKAKTWIKDGKNFVLSQEQVQKLLGSERMQRVAEKLKTTPDRLATILGEALPPLLEKFEAAKVAIDSASKSVPETSFVGGILRKVSAFMGNPSSDTSGKPKT